MDAAFILVIAKHPGVQRGAEGLLGGSSDLGFEARHRLEYTASTFTLVSWHAEASRDDGAWHERDGSIAFLTGHLRWRGEKWEPPSAWAERLALAGTTHQVDDLHDALRGVFIAGHLTSAGDGWVITDVLGLRCLYWGEDEDVVVVSSRAALVARGLSPDSPPRRDAEAASWLVFTGHPVGDCTGYRNVHVVPPGCHLRLSAGVPTWERRYPLIVEPDDDLRALSISDLAEIVQLDVADALRAALSHPAERHIIRLTGGKDSRLLLAAAVRAGLAHDFIYETVGPPELADVQIAAALCENLGLRHEAPFLGVDHSEPFHARFRRFVELTACMVNGRDLANQVESPDYRLTGLFGEPLRRFVQLREDQLTDAALPRAFPVSAFAKLGLLQPELRDNLHRKVLDLLATEPHPSADPRDRVHALFAGGRMRFKRFGPREELAGANRFHPLYSQTTLQAAMAMDPADRTAEVLFAEVMRCAAPLLVEHPFTDHGWDERAQAHLARAGAAPPVQVASRATSIHATPVMATIYATGSNDRIALLTTALADATNPAWELLDRTVALDALDRYGTLTTRQRNELFGAATAAVWLEG